MKKANISFSNGILKVVKQLGKDETYRVDERRGIFSVHIFKKPQTAVGITSMCLDLKHILMLDYDNTCRWIVETELTELAEDYPPFYLFTTKEEKKDGLYTGNYHAISLMKMFPADIVNLQRKTSCDNAYITMPLRNRFRSWVLRQSGKEGSGSPRFLKVIGNSHLDEEISEAHLTYLKRVYKTLPEINYQKKDGYKLSDLFFNTYETR